MGGKCCGWVEGCVVRWGKQPQAHFVEVLQLRGSGYFTPKSSVLRVAGYARGERELSIEWNALPVEEEEEGALNANHRQPKAVSLCAYRSSTPFQPGTVENGQTRNEAKPERVSANQQTLIV